MLMSNFKSRWGPLKTGIANALVYPVADSPGELISMSVLWFCILKGFSGLDSAHLLRYPRKSFSWEFIYSLTVSGRFASQL